jgi:hypothetical protein
MLLRGVCSSSDSTVAAVRPTPAGHPPPPTEGLEAWVNVHAIQTLTHHTSSVITAVILFSLVGFIIQRLMHDTWVKRCVLLIDELVLLALFAYFAYEFYLFL